MQSNRYQTLFGPCQDGSAGVNLEYDHRFVAMLDQAQPIPEREYGQTLVASKAPRWEALQGSCLEIAKDTRDLRVGVLLVESSLQVHGVEGFADALELLADWTDSVWSGMYPSLDASDNNDPTERLGTLARLTHRNHLLKELRNYPLLQATGLGELSVRAFELEGKPQADGAIPLTRSELEAIVVSVGDEAIAECGSHLQRALSAVDRLETKLKSNIGEFAWDGSPLAAVIEECIERIQPKRTKRNLLSRVLPGAKVRDSQPAPSRKPSAMRKAKEFTSTSSSDSPLVVIESREQAIEALDCLSEYFQQYEPASPIPLMLERTKRLIPMSFVEIMRELAPNGLEQALQSVGASEESVGN